MAIESRQGKTGKSRAGQGKFDYANIRKSLENWKIEIPSLYGQKGKVQTNSIDIRTMGSCDIYHLHPLKCLYRDAAAAAACNL